MSARNPVLVEQDAYEITCAACGQNDAEIIGFDPNTGFLLRHPGREFPCRVPLDPEGSPPIPGS